MNTFQYTCTMKFFLCQRWDSNQGTLPPKTDTLTTGLCRRKEGAIHSFLFIPVLLKFHEGGVGVRTVIPASGSLASVDGRAFLVGKGPVKTPLAWLR